MEVVEWEWLVLLVLLLASELRRREMLIDFGSCLGELLGCVLGGL